ncbi:MAG: hypothetical protein P1V35_03550 [Planctomycetota bacterium]|nr:hypothetical protein [Planctomycetota bacterium]
MTEHDGEGEWDVLLRGPAPQTSDPGVDLVAELEELAATESERFHELDRLQAISAQAVLECLERLKQADAVRRLSGACLSVLKERAALVDVDHLRVRSAEVIARESGLAPHVRWDQDFPTDRAWVRGCVREALDDILIEDEERFLDGAGPAEGPDFHHFCLIYSYGVDPKNTLEASVQFHRLPDETRGAFFALLVERFSVERCVALGLGPRFRLRVEVRSALKALLSLEDLWPSIQTPNLSSEGRDHESE